MAYTPALYKPGTLVRFTYTKPGTRDKYKEVFILNPMWQGHMHGIDMKRMTEAEREVILTIMNPLWEGKRHRLAIVNDIMQRMDPIEDIKNPVTFYAKMVKPFLRTAGDVYRRYSPSLMSGVQIVRESQLTRASATSKPLFGSPLFQKK